MTDSLRILILHNCENLASARRSTLDFIYSFERYAPEHFYFYHRIMLPFTQEITGVDWDVVILDSTACGVVTLRPRERFARIRERMSFLRMSQAVKFVFPQDDASHGALMDLWFNWLQIDALYTVRPEKVDLIYPITKQRAEVVSTLAGFLDDSMIEQATKFSKTFTDRQWVVGQRVTLYPAWGGRFARRKGYAAERMKAECERRGIRHNISTDPADVLLGDDWTSFLGDCQFVVGAEGGHGIWDPYGTIQDSANAYTTAHPGATFEEIEEACFLGLDGVHQFPGFAPRILEAAIAGCAQVLVRGNYRGLIQEQTHYIPLAEDFSNFAEVFTAMENTDLVSGMISATRRDLVDNRRFHYRTFVSDVLSHAKIAKQKRPSVSLREQAPETVDSWAALRLAHFRSLRAALANIGIEEERLTEPYLTAWIHRELGGQVTNREMRAALHMDEQDTVKPGKRSSQDTGAFEYATRSAVVQNSVSMIRSVNGTAESLILLIGELSADSDSLEKLLAVALDHRPMLLKFSLDMLSAVDGYADTLLPLAELLHADPSRFEKPPFNSASNRDALLRLSLNMLSAVDGYADTLLPLAELLHADPSRFEKPPFNSASNRDALLRLSLNMLSAVNGHVDALLPVVAALQSDRIQIGRLQEFSDAQRSELSQRVLGLLTSMDLNAETLVLLAGVFKNDASQLDHITLKAEQDRSELLHLALDILKAIDGEKDAIVPVASSVSPNAARLAAGLEILGRTGAVPEDRAAMAEVFKRHLLGVIGARDTTPDRIPDDSRLDGGQPEVPAHTPAEDVLDLLIAKADVLKDSEAARGLYEVMLTAMASRMRGPLIRFIARVSLEQVRARIARAFLSSSD